MVAHKRAHHIIKALSLMNNPPKIVFVGEGPMKEQLAQMAKDKGVDAEFVGSVSDEEKAKIIQESLFCVQPWSWLPITEAAFLERASIVYDLPDTRNRMGDVPIYSKANNPVELSNTIAKYLTEEKAIEEGKRAHKVFMDEGCHTYVLKRAVEKLCEIFDKVDDVQ
jgi:hypothetical protein